MMLKICTVFLMLGLAQGLKFLGHHRQYCLSADDNPYLYFSGKSSYKTTRGNAGSASTCKPIQIWSLNRHGTRLANPDDLQVMKTALGIRDKIMENYAAGVVSGENGLCAKDLEALRTWTWDESIEDKGNFLTEEGWKEVRAIAERYRSRYPALLGDYSEKDFLFRHTLEQRTLASCRAHIEGLFGDGAYDKVTIDEPQEQDDIIRPYAMCPAWIAEVDESEDRKAEKRIFRKQPDYLKLVDDVTKRLGFKKAFKKDDIDAMYDNCRFQKSWYPDQVSPWCAVFTKSELVFLEYHDDIGQFYKAGYGHPYHPKLGCRPLIHLLDTFTKTITGQTSPRVTAFFTHDTLMNMVYTALNFGKDQKPLKGTDYDDLMVNRKFRSSMNSPFAANIAVILHKCGGDSHEVQFFINERPMELAGCPNGLCSWQAFLNLMQVTKTCNLDFCNNAPPSW